MLDRDGHTNNLAFRTYVSGLPAIWIPVALASLTLVMFAARRARLESAAAMGVMLVPMVFNPANYYLHSVCVLAVLAEEENGSVRRLGAGIWLLLLLMCVASWPTSLPPTSRPTACPSCWATVMARSFRRNSSPQAVARSVLWRRISTRMERRISPCSTSSMEP